MGAAGLAAAPFIITSPVGLVLAIASLLVLCGQTIPLRLHNLTALQLLGAAGYAYSLLTM
jgi:hypothetical protein